MAALTLTTTMDKTETNTQIAKPSKLDKALDILEASSAAFNFLAAILGPLAMLYTYRKANQSNVQTAQAYYDIAYQDWVRRQEYTSTHKRHGKKQ